MLLTGKNFTGNSLILLFKGHCIFLPFKDQDQELPRKRITLLSFFSIISIISFFFFSFDSSIFSADKGRGLDPRNPHRSCPPTFQYICTTTISSKLASAFIIKKYNFLCKNIKT